MLHVSTFLDIYPYYKQNSRFRVSHDSNDKATNYSVLTCVDGVPILRDAYPIRLLGLLIGKCFTSVLCDFRDSSSDVFLQWRSCVNTAT